MLKTIFIIPILVTLLSVQPITEEYEAPIAFNLNNFFISDTDIGRF